MNKDKVLESTTDIVKVILTAAGVIANKPVLELAAFVPEYAYKILKNAKILNGNIIKSQKKQLNTAIIDATKKTIGCLDGQSQRAFVCSIEARIKFELSGLNLYEMSVDIIKSNIENIIEDKKLWDEQYLSKTERYNIENIFYSAFKNEVIKYNELREFIQMASIEKIIENLNYCNSQISLLKDVQQHHEEEICMIKHEQKQQGINISKLQKESEGTVLKDNNFSFAKERDFDVYLSHFYTETDIVEELAKRIEDNVGLKVRFDKWIQIPGKNCYQVGLNNTKCIVVCIGENTPEWWLKEEIARALNCQMEDGDFRVIPLLLPNAKEINREDFLLLKTWIDFRNGIKDGKAFHYLISGIKGVAPGRYIDNTNSSPKREKMIVVKQKLELIHELGELLHDDVIKDYQKKLLDEII